MGRSGFGTVRRREYLVELIARGPDDDAPPAWTPVFERYARDHRLLHARLIGDGRTELAFLITLRRTDDALRLTEELTAVPGVEQANLFYDEERPL